MKQQFSVTGMTCSACSAHVEKAARRVEGVEDVTVSLLTNSMTVTLTRTGPQIALSWMRSPPQATAHLSLAVGRARRSRSRERT